MQILKVSSIKANADLKVFERGERLYENQAVEQASVRENRLTGKCVGQQMPYYDISVELDDYGVRKSVCSCPFNFSGYCKHTVALLLKYANEPDDFTVRKSAAELVNSINKSELSNLLIKLLQAKPEIYDWVERNADAFQTVAIEDTDKLSRIKFRRLFDRIYTNSEDVTDVVLSAEKFLENGDAQSAVRKLLNAIESEIEEFPEVSYYDEGYVPEVESWSFTLTEALLTLETDEERENYEGEIDNLIDEAEEYDIEGLSLPLYVANNGWADSSNAFEDSDDYIYLIKAKLNVLERQGKDEEFLELAKEKTHHFRYATKLMELGKNNEGFEYALKNFDSPDDALELAKLLRELLLYDKSIEIAEKGLTFEGRKRELAEWLAPIEETLGNHNKALKSWKFVFAETPSLSLYQRIKDLSGKDWEAVQSELMKAFKDSYFYKSELAEILLFDKKWDEAMKLGNKENSFYGRTTEIVADGLIEHRPKWVVEISKSKFDSLVKDVQSKYYPSAVNWLKKAKLAYQALDKEDEWNEYFAEIKELYKRRPALQTQFNVLR